MRLTIQNTTKMVVINGVPARVWEGVDEAGTEVLCFITRLAVKEGQDPAVYREFEMSLKECRAPSDAALVFPNRMVL